MFKILAVVVSSLILFPSFAEADQCDSIRSNYSSSYSKMNTTCSNLSSCQDLREKCPQQIDEVGSCEVFKTCMEEQFPTGSTRTSKCTYEWNSQANEPGKCENKNRSIDIVANRCPGLTLYGDTYQDKNFNCNGHKGRYWSEHADFQRVRREYQEAMRDGVCFEVKLPDVPSCQAAFNSVSIVDNVHGGEAEVLDGPRDPAGRMQSIFDFQAQFEEGSYAADRDTSGHGSIR